MMTDRRRPAVHRCPDPGCGVTTVPRHHFACPTDWARLADEHRDAILTGYRRRTSDDGASHLAAMMAAVSWYRDNPAPGRTAPAPAEAPRCT